MIISHKFTKNIPDLIEEGVIYISMDYSTAIHKCCCGCGKEVVTPLSPMDWQLVYDWETVSLYPSIANWSFECESHYWIINNKIKWAPKWTRKQIEYNRKKDNKNKEKSCNKKIRPFSARDLFSKKYF